MTLSYENVERIKNTIKSSSITRTMMQENIVDHLCCAVEDKMQCGDSFDKAFQKAFSEFAPNGLQEIERETYILLNYKTILMKKIIYSLALLSSMAASFGIIFKTLHWNFANIILVAGMAGMTVTIPLILFKPGTSSLERTRNWFAMLSILLLTVGTLFKIEHLAGANVSLTLGMAFFSFGFLPLYFVKMYRQSVAAS